MDYRAFYLITDTIGSSIVHSYNFDANRDREAVWLADERAIQIKRFGFVKTVELVLLQYGKFGFQRES